MKRMVVLLHQKRRVEYPVNGCQTNHVWHVFGRQKTYVDNAITNILLVINIVYSTRVFTVIM